MSITVITYLVQVISEWTSVFLVLQRNPGPDLISKKFAREISVNKVRYQQTIDLFPRIMKCMYVGNFFLINYPGSNNN